GAEQSGFIAEIGFEMYHKILDEAIQELKDDEFKGLFTENQAQRFVTFTQIDTDLEVLIPDEYVTNIGERYNLYSEIANLETETQLEAFRKSLEDRFGPVPEQVELLLQTLRLQWLGKEIGFEKISLKKNVLRGYFVSSKQSAYYESDRFGKVLEYVQQNPTLCNLKEVRGSLRIAFEQVYDVAHAIHLLRGMAT